MFHIATSIFCTFIMYVFLNQTSTLHKPPDILEAPIFTRHPSRKLIANNKFDWFKFLSKIIEDKNGKHKYDFHFTVTPKKDTEILLNSNGHNIIHDNPRSWGVVLIFCCMFGFEIENKQYNACATYVSRIPRSEKYKVLGLFSLNSFSFF